MLLAYYQEQCDPSGDLFYRVGSYTSFNEFSMMIVHSARLQHNRIPVPRLLTIAGTRPGVPLQWLLPPQQRGECPSHLVIGNPSAKRAERRVLRCGHDARREVLWRDNVQATTVGKGTQVLNLFAVLEAEDLQRGDELQTFDACICHLGASEDEPP
jgi:hypothetical protein